jgi:GNAT-family acetyltransferase (TIGR03103 family)
MGDKIETADILDVENSPSLKSWGERPKLPKHNIAIDCGWGRLLFAHTFAKKETLAKTLREEAENKRDLALYVREPQVVVSYDPQRLFVAPSFIYRLILDHYQPLKKKRSGFTIRMLDTKIDIESINRIYRSRHMVEISPEFLRKSYNKRKYLTYWVAVDKDTKEVIATCMGIDHTGAFGDPENGASLWCLAVDPQASHTAIGLHMVQHVIKHYKKARKAKLDLSVMHSNSEAISLYDKLGFVKIPAFVVKNKNAINENLYIGHGIGSATTEELNPYSMIIINEARKRGIRVDIMDAQDNIYGLSHNGSSVTCRESLTDATSSIAMSRCMDRRTTARILKTAKLSVPDQLLASNLAENQKFMEKHGSIIVKPRKRLHGFGATVGVSTKEELQKAIKTSKKIHPEILLEEMITGIEMRVVVIDFKVVAAAIKKPPVIVGNGENTILQLVEKQSRRRKQATQGEDTIPVDKEFSKTVEDAGYKLDDILPKGKELQVRNTTKQRYGGTFHDVTNVLHQNILDAARSAAIALDIPVVGLDFIVEDPSKPEYIIIEAMERPYLVNYNPQPTAERFIDFLFPQSVAR